MLNEFEDGGIAGTAGNERGWRNFRPEGKSDAGSKSRSCAKNRSNYFFLFWNVQIFSKRRCGWRVRAVARANGQLSLQFCHKWPVEDGSAVCRRTRTSCNYVAMLLLFAFWPPSAVSWGHSRWGTLSHTASPIAWLLLPISFFGGFFFFLGFFWHWNMFEKAVH